MKRDTTSIKIDNIAGLPEKGVAIIKTSAEEFVVDYKILRKVADDYVKSKKKPRKQKNTVQTVKMFLT